MLRKIRIVLALFFFVAVTLLFLDFTGSIHAWLGWTAKVQFLPALLAVNAGVVLVLLLLTLLFGRVYCSVICPLGVMQDIVSWVSGRRKRKRYRFSYSKEIKWLRYGMLCVFVVALVAGVGSAVALLDPYSAYGRIATNLFAPLYRLGNNGLAYIASRVDSYAFYSTDVWLRSLPTFLIAVGMLVLVGVLAWRGGRTYCNTICPVGTILGFFSRFSLFRPSIDTSKCNNCKLCSMQCKASCINAEKHEIDYSRCVACMDCIDACKHGAIRFELRMKDKGQKTKDAGQRTQDERPNTTVSEVISPSSFIHHPLSFIQPSETDKGRRRFLTVAGMAVAASALKAQEKKVDGGLAVIEDKKRPNRATPIVPPGAWSARHFAQHCTGCQLCVSECPNGVLTPSTSLLTLMQPEMTYERGYCRPECTRCGEVCPAGAIKQISMEDKSAVRIGHAVWVKQNCVPLTDGVECGNCARHCPSGAILMVPSDPNNAESVKIPVVNTARCIGCGACEHLCPARPFSAIYVEGHEEHSVY